MALQHMHGTVSMRSSASLGSGQHIANSSESDLERVGLRPAQFGANEYHLDVVATHLHPQCRLYILCHTFFPFDLTTSMAESTTPGTMDDSSSMSPLVALPTELLLKILANVQYDDNYRRLRLVSHRFNTLIDAELPGNIVKTQYWPIHELSRDCLLNPKYNWTRLRDLHAHLEHHRGWFELLPSVDTGLVMTVMALTDILYAFRAMIQGFTTTERDSKPGVLVLDLARFTRLVFPPAALMLLQYVSDLTSEALKRKYGYNPRAQLMTESDDPEEVDANCLCRFLYAENKLLIGRFPPGFYISNKELMADVHEDELRFAKKLRAQLEAADLLDTDVPIRAGVLLHLAIDQKLKSYLLRQYTNQAGAEDEPSNNAIDHVASSHIDDSQARSGTLAGPQQIRQNLAKACRQLFETNSKPIARSEPCLRTNKKDTKSAATLI